MKPSLITIQTFLIAAMVSLAMTTFVTCVTTPPASPVPETVVPEAATNDFTKADVLEEIRFSETRMRNYMSDTISEVSSNLYCKLVDFEKRLDEQDTKLSGFSDDFKRDAADKVKAASVETVERNKLITLAIVESCQARQEKLGRDITSLIESLKSLAMEIDQLKHPELNVSNVIVELDEINKKFIELDNRINSEKGRADGFDSRLFAVEKKSRDPRLVNPPPRKNLKDRKNEQHNKNNNDNSSPGPHNGGVQNTGP